MAENDFKFLFGYFSACVYSRASETLLQTHTDKWLSPPHVVMNRHPAHFTLLNARNDSHTADCLRAISTQERQFSEYISVVWSQQKWLSATHSSSCFHLAPLISGLGDSKAKRKTPTAKKISRCTEHKIELTSFPIDPDRSADQVFNKSNPATPIIH